MPFRFICIYQFVNALLSPTIIDKFLDASFVRQLGSHFSSEADIQSESFYTCYTSALMIAASMPNIETGEHGGDDSRGTITFIL